MMNRTRKAFVVAALLWGALGGGCEAGGFFAETFTPDPPPLNVRAEYVGLENQKVAVLVDANQSLLFDQPLAPLEVSRAVSEKLADGVPGIKLVEPVQVVDFQNRNIYWNTMPYSEVAGRLGVTRLVLIELSDYRLHEPGNVNIWRGVMSGHVSVYETDSAEPNNATYAREVTAAYPPDEPLGVLDSNQRDMRFGTMDLFSRSVAGLFFEHKEPRKRQP